MELFLIQLLFTMGRMKFWGLFLKLYWVDFTGGDSWCKTWFSFNTVTRPRTIHHQHSHIYNQKCLKIFISDEFFMNLSCIEFCTNSCLYRAMLGLARSDGNSVRRRDCLCNNPLLTGAERGGFCRELPSLAASLEVRGQQSICWTADL